MALAEVPSLSPYAALPFIAMLLVIAICPVAAPGFWELNRNKLLAALVLGAPVLALYLARRPTALLEAGEEYVSFIALLSGLYAIAGGIRLEGDLEATPLTNSAFLAAGAVLASFIGTTGAAMLLIRALLQTNRERTRVRHTVVFFIFLACNIGGLLTPLGDPPLFLGYLQGVPFAWTFGLWRPWLLMNGALLTIYVAWDSMAYAREPLAALRRDRARVEPLRVTGLLNALGLLGVVIAVALLRAPAREIAIAILGGLSLWLTPRRIRSANGFAAAPMVEVAVVFFGIFLTMIPALELLRTHAPAFGVREPWQFFWATGLLSSVLDNAPTYVTLLALGRGLGLPAEVGGVPAPVLTGISLGAVCMGANTYIGNAPNFMVKSIAERGGVRMPTFFGYLAYSGAVLIPLFVVVTWILF
jgi:Na+/H+ antiporter NhaD/arsenite permease-like protein